MIFVDRTKIASPPSLSIKGCKGEREIAAAIKHFKTKRPKYVPFKFKAYNSDDVKAAVIKLFHGKCAYCESKTLIVYHGDIEHFRPKGEVELWKSKSRKKFVKPGYYKLACDWDNLYLACKLCNSKQKHELIDGSYLVTGKGNFFPLRKGGKNLTSRRDISPEETKRLLINPCVDNPETFFKYDETNGNILSKTKVPNKSDMVEASIEIYGLHRKHLADARLIVIKNLQGSILRIEEAVENLESAKAKSAKQKFQDVIDREITYLKEHCSSESEYAAVARQLYRNFTRKFN